MATERLSVASDMRIWWNWQTHRLEGLEVKTVQVRLLLSAPKTQTYKHISLFSFLIKNHLTFRTFLNNCLSKNLHTLCCLCHCGYSVSATVEFRTCPPAWARRNSRFSYWSFLRGRLAGSIPDAPIKPNLIPLRGTKIFIRSNNYGYAYVHRSGI